jgi:O-antigen ligase
MNKYGKFDQIKTASSMLFENHEQLFTGRGYLWSRTLPLLKDYIFVGSGPSTFVYAFPQNDYVGKYNNNFDSQVVTKPHNLYLQIAVETGLLSCIAFISLCVMYVVQTILTFRKSRLETIVDQMGVLICIGVVGYMVSGIINDSNVGVAPIFWILLGVGFACNKIIRTEQSRKKKIEAMDI